MKNKDIVTLANGGFLAATAHSLPVEHFYKFHRFKRAVEKANAAISAQQVDLLRDCGIDASKVSIAADKLTDAEREAQARFFAANAVLVEEESPVEVRARIPFECYKGVYDENRRTVNGVAVDIFANMDVEAIVLNNLFTEMNDEAGEGGSDV